MARVPPSSTVTSTAVPPLETLSLLWEPIPISPAVPPLPTSSLKSGRGSMPVAEEPVSNALPPYVPCAYVSAAIVR